MFAVFLLFAKAAILAKLSPLFVEIFDVCSNGVIPNLKSAMAVANCHRAGAVYASKEAIEAWAPRFCGKLRMVSLHYRELAMHPETKGVVCYRKA